MRGPAALTLTTAARVPGKRAAYEDELDIENRAIIYHYRSGPIDQPDNRALRAAFELQVPLIYFHGVAPGQYMVVQPVFVTADDALNQVVLLEVGLPYQDLKGQGLVSTPDLREYALREVRLRLHQQRFRRDVLRAYRQRCTICALREPALVQAAHRPGSYCATPARGTGRPDVARRSSGFPWSAYSHAFSGRRSSRPSSTRSPV